MPRLSIILIPMAIAALAKGQVPNIGTVPTFRKVDCPTNTYELCVAVDFDDGSEDLIMANKTTNAPTVLKGILKSTGNKAVIILRDNVEPKTNLEETVGIQIRKEG